MGRTFLRRRPIRWAAGSFALSLSVGLAWPVAGFTQTFREVARDAGIDHYCLDPHRVCGGVAFFDYDGDGFDDLYLTGGRLGDRLYRNRSDGTFEDVTEQAGLGFVAEYTTVGVATGDIDNDGDRDIFVTTFEGERNLLLRNDGDGTFTDITQAAGIDGKVWSTGVTFGDYDLDGFLDIYVANYATYDALPYDENLTGGYPNSLYRNNGDNTFDDVAAEAGVDNFAGLTLAVAFTDLNLDGHVDLFVVNDFGQIYLENTLYLNLGSAGAFEDVGRASGLDEGFNGMGITVGDYDEDGDLDLYVTNMERNRLYENRSPQERFEEVALARGVEDSLLTSWGAAFVDYDNDSNLDLFLVNGRVLPSFNLADIRHALRLVEKHQNRLWRGAGGGALREVSRDAGIADTTRGRGLAYADYDQDGDLDLFVAVLDNREGSARSLLYRNETDRPGNWLKVQLKGTAANRDAFGASVRVTAGNRSWIRQVDGGSSFLSQSSSVLHFGLGDHTAVDSLEVLWPGGQREVCTDVAANQTVRIVEGRPPTYASTGRDEGRPD